MTKRNRPVWKETVISLLLKRSKNICVICGEYMHKGDFFEVHHIVPKSKGGDDSMDNLAAVHLVCHRLKHKPNQTQIVKDGPKRKLGKLKDMVERTEVDAIKGWLDTTSWNITRAAEALDVSRPTLYEKMQKYGIQKP